MHRLMFPDTDISHVREADEMGRLVVVADRRICGSDALGLTDSDNLVLSVRWHPVTDRE